MRVLNNETNGLLRAHGVRSGVGDLAFAALTVAMYPIARYRIFTGFRDYDDEGYMLMSLKSFLNHGWLYDVFGGYGPFYYEFWGAVFSIFGMSVTNDCGRAATLVVWVLASLLLGLTSWRMTGSIILGLATQLAVFQELSSLSAEPMHPGGLIVLLVSAIMVFSCFVRDRSSYLSMGLLGAAVMALVLVKINVGIFALSAVALACVVSFPAFDRLRWVRPVIEVGFVALPLVLMSSKMSEAWVRQYALHVSAAALAVVIVLRARGVDRRDSKELWWLGGGLLVVGLALFLAILAGGASPSGLTEMIKVPLRFAGVFSFPLTLPSWTYVLDMSAVAGALGYRYFARNHGDRSSLTWTWVVSGASILIGLLMAFSGIFMLVIGPFVIGSTTPVTRLGLASLAWVALIQAPGKSDERTQFARLLLPPLAVLQTLHAFPVAGSQASWSAVLLIPVGALCIANGVRLAAFSLGDRRLRRTPIVIGAIAVTVAVAVLVSIQFMLGLDRDRAAYHRAVPLGLPGARDVRVSPKQAADYQATVAAVNHNCKSFVMLPVMNSFYLWSQQQPPADYKVTVTTPTALFGSDRQQRVIETIRSIEGLCLLENVPLAQRWSRLGAGGMPPGPLVSYLRHGFVPIATFGDYQLLKREGSGS
ncbi:hypothetical protein A5773_09140 [Mycobacterium sp. 852014-52450_SCH5900713]|uniref:hypothetical protein n=1 Tax=Mycobacterium sp. 852014-52450_SCH5900713 TaxID=1834116 RepID=UPI0008008C5C|nr:hypothetical protein [Mycobacterium sp. 852014-52450_SCH5900713]OBF98414.1 hypothetical protein A5773_09140 [Mycobacterium sp. 852014-52450_SCH5900713]